MLMHDHTDEAKREDRYCPLLKGICIEGWTESMGELPNKRRPKCVAWKPVTQVLWEKGVEKGKVDTYDCAISWMPDLVVQVANEAYHGAAATEEVRNHVAEGNGVSSILLAGMQAIARRFRAPILIPDLPKKQLDHKNGEGSQ